MGESGFIGRSLFVLGGLLIWAVHFTLVYGVNTLACARQFSGRHVFGLPIVPFTVSILTLLGLCAAGGLLLAALRRGAAGRNRPVDEFLRYLTIAIALLSLIAIAWAGVPAIMIPPCA